MNPLLFFLQQFLILYLGSFQRFVPFLKKVQNIASYRYLTTCTGTFWILFSGHSSKSIGRPYSGLYREVSIIKSAKFMESDTCCSMNNVSRAASGWAGLAQWFSNRSIFGYRYDCIFYVAATVQSLLMQMMPGWVHISVILRLFSYVTQAQTDTKFLLHITNTIEISLNGWTTARKN